MVKQRQCVLGKSEKGAVGRVSLHIVRKEARAEDKGRKKESKTNDHDEMSVVSPRTARCCPKDLSPEGRGRRECLKLSEHVSNVQISNWTVSYICSKNATTAVWSTTMLGTEASIV